MTIAPQNLMLLVPLSWAFSMDMEDERIFVCQPFLNSPSFTLGDFCFLWKLLCLFYFKKDFFFKKCGQVLKHKIRRSVFFILSIIHDKTPMTLWLLLCHLSQFQRIFYTRHSRYNTRYFENMWNELNVLQFDEFSYFNTVYLRSLK